MQFDVITLFPKMFEGPFSEGIVSQAIKRGDITLNFYNPRDVAKDVHQSVDDRPFGGGPGMVLLPEILKETLDKVPQNSKRRVVYLSPQGQRMNHQKARQMARDYDQIVLICGRYGGVDERFLKKYVDEEISVGDYVLSGGELAAMTVMDATSRFLPGTLGNDQSPEEESFKDELLEQPLYTRPWEFEGETPPEILRSGHHEKIEKWRRQQRVGRTIEKRPDLMANSNMTQNEINESLDVMPLRRNLAVGLVHYPIYNKTGKVVATNVTNFDIHDISRICRTYGVDQFYIITPSQEQLAYVGRVLDFWKNGRGIEYNPTRNDALRNTRLAPSIEAALEHWDRPGTKVVATSARVVSGPTPMGFTRLREEALKDPQFLVFGTGYGLENGLVRNCDYLLEPIRGRSPDGFRHLPVRAAVSIILDRLFGTCY